MTSQNDQSVAPAAVAAAAVAAVPEAPASGTPAPATPAAGPPASETEQPPLPAAPAPEGFVSPPVEPEVGGSSADPQRATAGPAVGALLAALTGFLYYASFPGLDIWPLAFVAFVPWLVSLEGASPGRAAREGLIAGMVIGLFGFYWLLEMLQVFSGFGLPLCTLFLLLLCAYQAGRFVLFGWLYARGAARGWPKGLVLSAAFVASELGYPLLFPFTFAATMHEVLPIAQVADLGGTSLLALVTLAPSYPLARLLLSWLEARRSGARRAPLPRAALLVGFGVPLLATVYGTARIAQVESATVEAERLKVGVVQANMGLKEKRAEREEGLKRHLALSKKLRDRHQVDLIVWPETSVSGAIAEDQAERHYKRVVTSKIGVPAIVGAVLARPVDDEREYVLFNSALSSAADGTITGRYDKQFLLAFGEYLPFGEDFPVLYEWSPNSGRFTPGESFAPLDIDGHPVATFICYEDISPRFVNRMMQDGKPQLLVNMTNDAWFGDTSEPWEHMALAKLRAIEQRRYFVRATNSGVSAIVDPVGRTLEQTRTFEEAAIAAEIAYLDLDTVYRQLGDGPFWLLGAASLAFSFIRRPRRPSSPSAPDPASPLPATVS